MPSNEASIRIRYRDSGEELERPLKAHRAEILYLLAKFRNYQAGDESLGDELIGFGLDPYPEPLGSVKLSDVIEMEEE